MSETPVNLSGSGGLPETILPPWPGDTELMLQNAGADREAIAAIVADEPRFLAGWVALGDLARDPIEAYAYYRVGYHRGLDALRANGWRGSGYVRWRYPTNRGFLCAVDGLRRIAAEIGEADEAERCKDFLHQLDPEWDQRFDPPIDAR